MDVVELMYMREQSRGIRAECPVVSKGARWTKQGRRTREPTNKNIGSKMATVRQRDRRAAGTDEEQKGSETEGQVAAIT